ncbi:MAG: simple sugar transport system ATP-binding protein, partial [Actinoplanes sp.]|nr:simple sugar transport system ATP-binding protein [Actinoplanes sp.]
MTDTLAQHADSHLQKGEPLIEMTEIGKSYGAIRALRGINLRV